MSATLLKNSKWFSDNAIDIDFIKAHETLDPRGPRHVPVSHALILDKFRDKCNELNLSLINEQGALSKSGDKYMYVAEVEPDITGLDYHMSVGFRSFNDESSVFQISCGASVLMCANGLQTSICIPSRKKHTASIMELLDNKIDIGLSQFKQDSQITEENIAYMKNTPYSDDLLGKLIVSLGRTKKIGNTNIMKILDEVDNPSYNNHNDNSAWRIMNACTTVTTHRMLNPLQAANTSQIMHDELMKIIKPGYIPLGDNIDNVIDIAA